MMLEEVLMISFKGNHIGTSSVIQRYNFLDVTSNCPVSFVEMNPFDESDVCSMNKVAYIWGNNGGESSLISDIFQYEGKSTNDVESRYFVLTKQNEDFDKIRPSKVLGIVKTTNAGKNSVEIDGVQVNPFYVYNNPYSDLSEVGKTMMKLLQDNFSDKNLFAYVPKNVIPFFKKLGWTMTDKIGNTEEILMKLNKTAKHVNRLV